MCLPSGPWCSAFFISPDCGVRAGDAVPNLAGDDRRRYECHYRMMKDYQENKRDTDRYTDAKYRTMLVVDQTDNRASIITVDLCWGNFKSSCNRIAKDVGCNLDRRFG